MMRKRLVFIALVLCVSMLFSSCGEKLPEPSLYVELVEYRTDEADVEKFASKLKAEFPQYADMNVSGSSLDDPGIGFQIIIFMFANEIELFICDASAAPFLAAQGDNFIPLADLFTEEEIASFNGTGVTFEKEDDYGVKTGELSPVCGLDLTDSPEAVELTAMPNPQIFIVASTLNIEAAKETFKYLATL